MKKLINSYYAWILFLTIALLSGIVSYIIFPYAFSLIKIPITMNRSQALNQASKLSRAHKLGPEKYLQAASFKTNDTVKNYIELEAGGKAAFESMIEQKLYEPYTWVVRHFSMYNPHELLYYFTPTGTPYGFYERLSESLKRDNVSAETAQEIFEHLLPTWNIDISEYILIDRSEETVSSGRIDHTFTYERPHIKIGDAPYQLIGTVSGDRVSKLIHRVKVPQAFYRRYTNIRTSNETITAIAQFTMQIFYLLICGLLGILLLIINGYFQWRYASISACILALLSAATSINQLPLYWMNYPTAVSTHGFFLSILNSILYNFLYTFVIFFISIAAAESLTRYTFGSFPQFWKLWAPSSLRSSSTYRQVIIPYMIMPCIVLYILSFYIIATKYFNWWIPASSFFDPDILATYIPWLSPIARSIKAGFWEECVFRAIPLSCAVLLGRKFGKKNWWLIAGFIVQIIIFGAVHANYPMQPAYARIIELIIPSIIFGLLYLRYGLLPGIILHIIYDIFWMSLPLFVSTASGALLFQIIILLITITPLLIISYNYMRYGKHSLPESLYNHSWQQKHLSLFSFTPSASQKPITLSHSSYLILMVSTIISVSLWYSQPFKQDARPLKTERSHAIYLAHELFKQHHYSDTEWFPVTTTQTQTLQKPELKYQHKFVWQYAGPDAYKKLLGHYLQSPYHIIRYITLFGSIEDRAQEYWYYCSKNKIFRIMHQIPEHIPGASLTKEEAEVIAHTTITNKFKIDPQNLSLLSAKSEKKIGRVDWKFTYADTDAWPHKQGKACIVIEIDGNYVADYYRYIHVPEDWKRTAKDVDNTMNIIKQLSLLLLYLIFGISIAISLISITHSRHILRTTAIITFILCTLYTIITINGLPQVTFFFNTSEPWSNQLFIYILYELFYLFIRAIGIALTITTIFSWTSPTYLPRSQSFFFTAFAIGLWLHSINLIFLPLISSHTPLWAKYTALGSYIPYLQEWISAALSYITITTLLLFTNILINYGSHNWQKNRTLFSIFILLFGFLLAGIQQLPTISLFVLLGISYGLSFLSAYIIAIQYDLSIIPLSTAVYYILYHATQSAYNAYTGALFGHFFAIISIAGISWFWAKYLNQK